ncbi:hypothetical protein V202x_23000 [Gimesia aquarii]|uniref:Uncharacterized protein n=1 Tax=Gimesia aquarii TaxID=2527964 RepID=A0A517WUI8_9PLAN|nr:hypothetical protein V202x_23000 [Gimesia aquarii]
MDQDTRAEQRKSVKKTGEFLSISRDSKIKLRITDSLVTGLIHLFCH